MNDCRNTEHTHLGQHERMRFCTPEMPHTSERVENARTEWIKVAEMARQAHHLAASTTGGDEYKRSQEAFIATIGAAYPTLDKFGIYGLWVDCMESVAYCVKTWLKLDRDDQRKYIAMGGGLD